MKLNKAKQKQLDTAYDSLIQVCLYDRPLREMEPFLADDVMNFGAGKKEITKTKTAFLKQIKNQKKLAAGLKMDFYIKPILRKITNKGDGAIYTDDIVNTVWVNGAKNKLKFRLSFIFEYKQHRWIMVHSHTSAPDSQRTDNEIWPVEELKKRTELLEKSLDEKIAELEIKNRELEIEAALERVRARTMAMQRSSELAEVALLLFQQVKDLGITAWAAGFNIWQADNASYIDWITGPTGDFLEPYTVDAASHPVFTAVKEAKQRGDDFFVSVIEGDQIAEVYGLLNSFADKGQFQKILDSGMQFPTRQINHFVFGAQVSLMFITYEPCPEARNIFKHFGKVFEQTYTRFLDLKKAEGQVREAQIEAALERVRTKAMAMQKSDDLANAVAIVFEELDKLNLGTLRCGIAIVDKENPTADVWSTTKSDHDSVVQVSGDQAMNIHPLLQGAFDAWQKQENDYNYVLEGEDLNNYYKALTVGNFKLPESQSLISGDEKICQYYYNVIFRAGGLFAFRETPFPNEAKTVIKRFADVFNLTYTRFNDLKQAEAQAGEAKIEAALERVRSRTMAMQHSDELKHAASLLFQQVRTLGVPVLTCGYNILEKDEQVCTAWMSSEEGLIQPSFKIPLTENPTFIRFYDSRQKGEHFYAQEISGEELAAQYRYMLTLPAFREIIDGFQKGGFSLPESQVNNVVNFSHGNLVFVTYKPVPESWDIFKRFAAVFEQTYTRFIDLQKAEAQAREAQIEASLERVRSKAMAMQKSEDLAIAVSVIFEELEKLNHKIIRCGIAIHNKIKNTADLWTTTITDKGRVAQVTGDEPMDIHPMLQGAYESWLKQTDYTYTLQGDDLINFYKALTSTNFNLPGSQSVDMKTEGLQQHLYVAHFPAGGLYAFSQTSFPDETKTIIRRFADVFNLTYTRFSDLQKAEAQAREATIEAALEKVRGKSMAMHTSDDLSATASMVFTELRKLGINPIRCGVGLLSKESRKAQLYSATSSAGGDSLSLVGWIMLSNNPVAEKIYESWLRNEDYYPELSGEQLKLYYENLLSELSLPAVPDWQGGQKQYGHFLPFSVGCLYAWSEIPYNDTEIKILKRFATIIDLTFRRYLDLQKSEASAKVAVRQASLDRVRAEIASMRTTSDLEKITPLIWNELTILGIPFIRCGVFIMDDSQKLIHTFLSTPDGKALAAFHLPYNTPGNFKEMVNRWHHKQTYIAHWGEAEFISIADVLVKQGAIATKEQYLHTLPSGGFYLHFLPFLQGMLYVGNVAELGNDEILLIQSVADAFSTAYARYEDFNKLEVAKQTVEKTLVDLKQAQTQLVQSEKMASLGELTAGIAHEIQNPLNFVNNFSEVNKELVDELQNELKAGNTEEAIAISNDIKVNEEKINHHGKRADSIVKGMLQHSRSSSGVKEPTNINILADEYLRLSYHGLRAKDKSFNATLKTDFDETIGNINIIPQDVGRVLLNLYNNAFYAVNEKFKMKSENLPTGQAAYEPTISVSTKKVNNTVELTVRDNGNGIPQKIVDKIFQPFFTTKPTGQGTGLGLSLSYDIVKAHGGDIKVETKEGDGSEFIIQLPIAAN